MKSIHFYTIKSSGGLKVEISNLGAKITKLLVANRKGEVKDIVLGFKTADEWRTKETYFNAICGRVANRINDSVSREKHAVITYVPKQKFFLAQPGESRELFYVNDKVVLENVNLNAKDILEIGRSKFMFVPLCGEKFSWDDYSRN